MRTILLSESALEHQEGTEVIVVPQGTKLSKLRHLADRIDTDLFCICDPDLAINADSCRTVLLQAMAHARSGAEVVAFGVVEGKDTGTLLSQVMAIDKWWSHRVLRRGLWASGIGITIPGQFLIVSSSLLRGLDHRVDSYLDDLYLGWIARQRGVHIGRVAAIVGQEEPRGSWTSLVTQRMRWMRGIASLGGHLALKPSAVALLGVHYFAYHGLPIVLMAAIVLLVLWIPLVGICAFLGLAMLLAVFSGRPIVASIVFLGVFPVLHVFATIAWWIPVPRSVLTRR